MKNKTGAYKIPFDPGGSQHDYPVLYPNNHPSNSVWFDNYEFTDTLSLNGYGRGRSSITFSLARTNGTYVSVFVSDFVDMVHKMVEGKITGTFTFVKKGQNYGCKLV